MVAWVKASPYLCTDRQCLEESINVSMHARPMEQIVMDLYEPLQ